MTLVLCYCSVNALLTGVLNYLLGVGVGGPIMNGHDILIPITITDPSHQIPVNAIIRSRNMSCFNCGSKTHYGQDCKELSMEEMTKCKFIKILL